MAEEIIGRVHPETETQAERIASEITATRVELLDMLNAAYSLCEPISLAQFNQVMKTTDPLALQELEANDTRIGVVCAEDGAAHGISTLSLIATITHVLIGKRMGVTVSDDGMVMEFVFTEQQ